MKPDYRRATQSSLCRPKPTNGPNCRQRASRGHSINKAVDEWKRPPREWSEAKTQFAVIFGERFVT